MTTTKFTFLMIPTAVAEDAGLSPGAKILFGAILSATKMKMGRCIAGNKRLAKMAGLSVIQTRRLLAILEQQGMISRVMSHGERTEIRVLWTGEGERPPVQSYAEYLRGEHWKARRAETLRADRHRCRLCNSPDGLNVHHRSYERLGAERDDDLITLCRECHAKFHDKVD